MPKKAIIIVGLPGSGKTHLAQQKLAENPSFKLFDDLDQSRFGELLDAMDWHKDVIITGPHLIKADAQKVCQELMSGSGYEMEWIFFENDPGQCLINIMRRDDGRKVEGTIQHFSGIYTYPEGAVVLPVYRET